MEGEKQGMQGITQVKLQAGIDHSKFNNSHAIRWPHQRDHPFVIRTRIFRRYEKHYHIQ